VDLGGHTTGVSFWKVYCGAGDVALVSEMIELTDAILPCLGKAHVDFILREPGTIALCTTQKDKVTATACLRRAHPQLFQLSFLCVHPKERRNQLGSKLLKRIVSHCRQYRCPKLAVFADVDAVGFFEKQGFTAEHDVPTDLVFWLDKYLDAQLMVTHVHPRGDRSNSSSSATRESGTTGTKKKTTTTTKTTTTKTNKRKSRPPSSTSSPSSKQQQQRRGGPASSSSPRTAPSTSSSPIKLRSMNKNK